MFDNIETNAVPNGRKGRERTDLSPLLEAADNTAAGDTGGVRNWASVVGTSSLHTYRTRLQSGETEGAPVGKYEVKVQPEAKAEGEVGEDGYVAPTFRLFIRVADAKDTARLIANADRRAARLAEGASDDEVDAEETAPANPLG